MRVSKVFLYINLQNKPYQKPLKTNLLAIRNQLQITDSLKGRHEEVF